MYTEAEIRDALSRYHFYHVIPLTDSISTPGNPVHVPAQRVCMSHLRQMDLKAKRVLDIGCRDGLFSFAAESMGAAEVIGIDNDCSRAATEFLVPFFRSKVRFEQMNLYDMTPARFGLFDVVVFAGVLYHLRYPFWGLRAIRDVMSPGGRMIVETAIWESGDENRALLFCPVGSDSPYEATSPTFFNEKGLVDTLRSLGFRTTALEYVRTRPPPGPLVRRLRNLRNRFRTKIVRCVVDCAYDGFDRSSSLTQYFEGAHDLHSRLGF